MPKIPIDQLANPYAQLDDLGRLRDVGYRGGLAGGAPRSRQGHLGKQQQCDAEESVFTKDWRRADSWRRARTDG